MNSNPIPLRQHFEEIDSTNRVALDWSGAPPFSVVSAASQTNGRGRLGRTWNSPSGKGLYFSVVNPPVDVALASLLSGLAVAHTLERLTSLAIRCKWPNDLICRDFKIGGILCESKGAVLVVGIGINISHEPEDLPVRSIFPASSLTQLGAKSIESDMLLNEIVQEMRNTFELSKERALSSYESKMYGIGEVAKVGKLIGVLQGIDESGHLLLKTADGMRPVLVGDVEFFAS